MAYRDDSYQDEDGNVWTFDPPYDDDDSSHHDDSPTYREDQ